MNAYKSLALSLLLGTSAAQAEPQSTLLPSDIFSLEYASGVTAGAESGNVFFIRNYVDIYQDKKLGNIWQVDKQGQMLPVTSGAHQDYGLALSPDKKRLAYISTQSGKPQIHLHWLDKNIGAQLSHLTSAPSGLTWSPDGSMLAFKMFVKAKVAPPVSLSGMPQGAKWAEPAVFIDDVIYRNDGAGYAEPGYVQLFVMDAQGGSPRQLTFGNFNHSGGLSWSKDGKFLYFSANLHEDFRMAPLNTEIYQVELASTKIDAITERNGPDNHPAVSPDGKYLAYLGYDDKRTNYENNQLYLLELSSGESRSVSADLDRSISDFKWDAKGRGLYIQYDDQGKTLLAFQGLKGKRQVLTDSLGGQSYGRPYTGAEFDVSDDGSLAFTYSRSDRPADIAVLRKGEPRVLTRLNDDALGHKTLGKVEEIWYKSQADGLDIQGWIVYPPGFDASKKYPLLLEIHGGPTTAYGPHFSAEVQLFAAAGYVVLYTNPRGSSSYGQEFAQTIHHNYPSQDYDDLMSGVDVLIDKGFIDAEQMFVTGGSGGGVLTAWIVGHTDRFKAAVVAKPVINWFSFVLTSDFYPFFSQYWFAKKPWEDPEHYLKRSPISYVGNVTTPTMLLTGEADYRTPMSETEQYYQALKLQGVDTAMVRIPDAPHGIYKRPSNLMAKVEYILWWFEKYRGKQEPSAQ